MAALATVADRSSSQLKSSLYGIKREQPMKRLVSGGASLPSALRIVGKASGKRKRYDLELAAKRPMPRC